MSYYHICPHCGAHLDPGEKCDCLEALRERLKAAVLELTEEQCAEILRELREKGIAVQSAANTPDGKAEQMDKPVSASIVTETENCVKEVLQ